MTATRKPRPLNLSSHTELSTLAHCERRWHYQYVQKIRSEKSDAMITGILLGLCCNAFWRGESWELEVAKYVCEEGADVDSIDVDQITEYPYCDVVWLMHRYEREYDHMRSTVKVIGQEVDCRAKIPGTTQVHQAIADELWQIGKRSYMVERKSYGRNDKADFVDYDPQLTNNLWVAREHTGLKLDGGIIWDGIYTHRWVPSKPTQTELITDAVVDGTYADDGETLVSMLNKTQQRDWARGAVERHPGVDRPDGDSFTMLYLDRTAKHIEQAQLEIGGVLRRRAQLRKGVRPVRNQGPFCKNCPAKEDCFADLAFPQAFDVIE